MALDKIKFATNVPIELALKYTDGKLCDSQFGDPQYMFSTTDNRAFFVAEKVAQKIHGLRLHPGEPIDIVKAEVDYGNGRKGIEWQISRVDPPVGQQQDGTCVVPGNGAAAGVTAPAAEKALTTKPVSHNGNGSTNGKSSGNGHAPLPPDTPLPPGTPPPLMPWALFLLAQTKQVIDVYALACQHASEKHGNLIRTDDVRNLLTTVLINLAKKGVSADVA